MIHAVLRTLTGPVLAEEIRARYMNFLFTGKIRDYPVGGGLGLPLLNPGHSAGTLPFAATVDNTIPYPSEAGQDLNLSAELASAFPSIPDASIDAYRLTIGGAERFTRGVNVVLYTYYTSTDPSLQPSQLSFTMLQAPVVVYLFSLRRQAGRLFLSPVSVSDGLTYRVGSNDPAGVQGTNIDVNYRGVTFSDPIVCDELARFDFFKGDPSNGCYHKSR